MKKMMLAVAGMAMAVVTTGCGSSPKSVAEKFVDAIIHKDGDKAIKCIDVNGFPQKAIKEIKEIVENTGKGSDVNDEKLETKVVREMINVPAKDTTATIVNGKKYIDGETATVDVQFVKGKDKKKTGMSIPLVKVDGSWKVDYKKIGKTQKQDGDKTKTLFSVKEGFDTEDDK